jgi:3-hydroxybutyryl-CoA dehydrogenase
VSETNNVGLVGLGFLGRGIAACLVAHKVRVVAHVRSADSQREAEAYIERAMHELVVNAGFPADLPATWRDAINFVTDYESFHDVDFVIETVVEDVEIKNQVFDDLERVVGEEVPIASNTSSLAVSLLAERRRNPERFLGMHWAEPAYATRFIELIRGDRTNEAAFGRAIELANRVGKEPSLVQKDVPAFVVNRIGYAMLREALNLLEEGVADAETIDRSFRHAIGLWAAFAGPLRWVDLSGGPALYGKTMSNVLPTLSNATQISPRMRKMMENDDKGIVNGRGFYQYTSEETQKWEDRFRRSVWHVWHWADELAREKGA